MANIKEIDGKVYHFVPVDTRVEKDYNLEYRRTEYAVVAEPRKYVLGLYVDEGNLALYTRPPFQELEATLVISYKAPNT